MRLKTQLFRIFFIIVLFPAVLTGAALAITLSLQAGRIGNLYGIDLSSLAAYDRTVVVITLFFLVIVLLITAFLLSAWLYRGIATPISNLTGAMKNVRDGNLDFELKPEGNVLEIRELYSAFDEMKRNLKEANEEKIAFDRENRELISNISHDLKTPITAVKGYVEGIMDGVADTPEKMER